MRTPCWTPTHKGSPYWRLRYHGVRGRVRRSGQGHRIRLDADAYPHLVAFTVEHVFQPGYEFGDTFEVGFDVILEAVSDFVRDT